MKNISFKMYDLSPQASGEGSGYEETRPSKPDVEKHRWTVWDDFYINEFFYSFDYIHLLFFDLPHYLTLAERCFMNNGTFRCSDFALPILLDTLLSWSTIFSLEIALKLKKSHCKP